MAITDTLTAFDTLVRWSLTAVVWGSAIVLAVLAVRWMARNYEASQERARERQREKWAVNSGDQGGMPVEHRQSKAPETGSGLPVGAERSVYKPWKAED